MKNYICRVEWSQTDWDWYVIRAFNKEQAEEKMKGRFPTARYISIYGEATILE